MTFYEFEVISNDTDTTYDAVDVVFDDESTTGLVDDAFRLLQEPSYGQAEVGMLIRACDEAALLIALHHEWGDDAKAILQMLRDAADRVHASKYGVPRYDHGASVDMQPDGLEDGRYIELEE